MRGDGSVYEKRPGCWWIKYYFRGQPIREPGGLDGRAAKTEKLAEKKLRKRLKAIHGDRFVGVQEEKLTVEDVLDAYVLHLEQKQAKSVAQVRSHLKPVREFFSLSRAVDVTTTRIRTFVADRSKEVKAETVNRSLQDFRAALNLARKEEKLSRIPYFPIHREDNARRGFFERDEHEAILPHLPDPHCDIAEFGYRTGWRRGEIEPLEWKNVDRDGGTVFLMDSKNGEPRTFPLRDEAGNLTELGELIEKRWKMRVYQTKEGPKISAYVFHHRGRRVWTFDEKWRKATEAARVPCRLFHDYRRTAVRDLVRAGVPQAVAMSITGHKTDSVFRRYNITSDADKQEAIRKLTSYRAAKQSKSNVVPMTSRNEASR